MYNSPTGGPGHECDNCGAKLPPPDESGTRTCQFCKAVYTAPAPTNTAPPQVNLVISAPGFTAPSAAYAAPEFNPVNAPSGRSGCGCGLLGWIIFLVVVGSIAVPVYLAYKAGTFTFDFNKTDYRFGASSAVLPGEPGQPLNYVTTGAHYDSGRTVITVMRVNGADGKAVWKANGVPDGVSDTKVAVDASNVYVAGKSTLLAFKLSDGSQVWKATLSDDYAAHDCADCLSVIGTSAIVKTKDGSIQAFDTATGKALWTHDLASTSGQVFRMPTQLVVLDEQGEVPAERVVSLTPLDPATGTPGTAMQPTCVDPERATSIDELDTSDLVRHSTRSPGSLILAYGSSPSCLQSWDTVAGAMSWNLHLPDINPSGSSFSFIEAEAGVFVANYGDLAFVWQADGRFQPLAKAENTQFSTISISGSMLIAQAKNTRGTTKTSLQGYDVSSGTKTWEVLMGSATSIDDPDETSFNTSAEGTYTAHVHDGKLAVVLFAHTATNTNALSLLTIDANTGTVAPRVELDARTTDIIPVFGPSTWSGSRVLVRVGDDTVHVVDTAGARAESVFTGS